MSDGKNLPVFVQNVGGQLAEVLAWPQYLNVLSIGQTLQISMMVTRNPILNSERCVDMLANLACVYREHLGPWFDQLLQESSIEEIHMAVETLYELGVCSVGEMQEMEHEGNKIHPLEQMLSVMDRLRRVPHYFEEVEGLARLIEDLGGWARVAGLKSRPTLSEDEQVELTRMVGPRDPDTEGYADDDTDDQF